MRTDRSFRPMRVILLIRNALVLNRSSIAFVAGAAAGILLFVSLMDVFGARRPRLHQYLYLLVLFSGGLLLTGRSFKALHDPVQGLSWLLLPASLLEKTLARVLLTTVVYAAGSMLLYLAFSILSEGLNLLLFERRHALFFPFDPLVLKGALTYTAVQAPFLLGAVYFRKHALSKTVLVLLGFSLLLALGVVIAARIIFGGELFGADFQTLLAEADFNGAWLQLSGVVRAAAGAGKIIFWLIMPVVCWTICWFRLKETER